MKFRDYFQVRDWLESFIPYTYSKKNLGLARIRYLLKLLGNPQDKFKSIHIAGTSGKGSTAFYIAQLLQMNAISHLPLAVSSEKRKSKSEKLRIGLHLSPHLVDIRERMQVNSRLIPLYRYIRLMNEIRSAVDAMKGLKVGSPSYFEILVAASFLYFAKEKVDWAVVEVGLGGRLDATNVLKPKLSVITNVGLDHTDILGTTIEKIAFEKAGIIKEKTPVVTAACGKALKVIKKVAKEKSAQLITIDTQLLGVQPLVFKNKIYKYVSISHIKQSNSNNFPYKTGNLDLAGSVLSTLGFRFTAEIIKKVSKLTFPGRFEGIDDGVILDGAHNPDKIQFLIEFLSHWLFAIGHSKKTKDKSPKAKGIVLVLALKKGKDWKRMVDFLIKNLPVKKVIATKFYAVTDTGKFSAVEPREIADYISSIVNGRSTIVESINSSQQAVFEALKAKGEVANGILLVTGSLYLVGEARTIWHLPAF